jgi:hypothetical protein
LKTVLCLLLIVANCSNDHHPNTSLRGLIEPYRAGAYYQGIA